MAGRNSTVGVPAKGLAPRIRTALAQLAEAHRYAQDAQRDVWDFAVEIASLHGLGLTHSDLRWLACKGYVEHAREVTQPGEDGRAFRPTGDLTFSKRTCFILTQSGLSLARTVRPIAAISVRPAAVARRRSGDNRGKRLVPRWDASRHELRVGGKLVKRYKLPSPNQETILMAFQEEGWPACIDDPLPPNLSRTPSAACTTPSRASTAIRRTA